jgi:hypothetical protein
MVNIRIVGIRMFLRTRSIWELVFTPRYPKGDHQRDLVFMLLAIERDQRTWLSALNYMKALFQVRSLGIYLRDLTESSILMVSF